jgi:HPr kinase/phosphorylase
LNGAAAAGPGEQHHASAVAVGGRGLLITGAPGTGKTTLTLELVALGARLIADDRVVVTPDEAGALRLSAPPNIAGLAEIRGFGLARLAPESLAASEVPLALIADLDRAESERLPPPRHRIISGIACRVILCKGKLGTAAALTCLLGAADWPGPEQFCEP